MSKQVAYDLLKLKKNTKVLALPKGDREVLLATLELERDRLDAALAWLNNDIVQHNSLAALIKGEVFRRKSFAAAMRAGSYAHAAHDNIEKLGNAELTLALREAEKRLLTFMLIDEAPHKQEEHTVTRAVQDTIKAALQSWVRDWESLNHDAYISHYDSNFHTSKYDYQSWSRYKKRINQKKTYIHVTVSNISMRADSFEQGEAVIVSFEQIYQSSNYTTRGHKELYFIRRNQAEPWLILEEGRKVHTHHAVLNTKQHAQVTGAGWMVNMASFHNKSHAQEMAKLLGRYSNFQPFIMTVQVAKQTTYRVCVGSYQTKKQARKVMQEICTNFNITDCWLEKKS